MSESAEILRALRTIPSPVAVLTVATATERNGLIVSWFTPVSGNPPLVAVALRENRYSNKLIVEAQSYTINLLHRDQSTRVPQFKKKGQERSQKFDDLAVAESPQGHPYLPDSVAVLHCRLRNTIATGDHILYIGEVMSAQIRDGEPMTTISLGKTYDGVH